MRTRLKGRYVIGFDHGHHILPDAEVVYENDRIVFVGRAYDGPVDRTIDASDCLVSPGFINLHAVTNVDLQVFRIDVDTAGFPKPRAWVEGGGPEALDEPQTEASVRFSVAALLKGGATTFGAITTMASKRWEDPRYEPEMIADIAGQMGARAYVAHQVRAVVSYWDGAERHQSKDEARGLRALEYAAAFAKRIHGTYDDRIRGYMFPYTLDASTPALLQGAKQAADAIGTHMRTHFAQSLTEVHDIVARYGKTPVDYLESLGVLDRNLILTHALYIAGNGPYDDPEDRDLRRLARYGVTVCHCPGVYLRRGITLNSFSRYRRAGVNMALGTDTFPQDVITEMKWASLAAKFVEQTSLAGTAAEVYHAATLGGARALSRDDLGRLSPGAKADIVTVDLNQLHIGPVVDPIKTLVRHATSRDIRHVIIDGRTVVDGGTLTGVDEDAILAAAQAPYDRLREQFARWDRGHRPARVLFPAALPTIW
ncbi:MAG: chlorohydrolase family protein [Armatimonadota bacterium]|nr:chlorohydrolase family protein [Armatimonadota bacterium]